MRWMLFLQLAVVLHALPMQQSLAVDEPDHIHVQQVVWQAAKKVQPAVVYLAHPQGPGGCSGTLISSDGLILTCAHINAQVGDELVVHTFDGRELQGKVLGKSTPNGDFGDDLALVQLASEGPWPFVKIASTEGLTKEQPLMMLGHPMTGILSGEQGKPLRQLRIGYQMLSEHTNRVGLIRTTIRMFGGDSGGPIFDLDGRLLGVATNYENGGVGLTFNTVDLLQQRWSLLGSYRPMPSIELAVSSELPSIDVVIRPRALEVQRLVVDVQSNFRTIASGLIVARGKVLTKASELGPNLTVAFTDESVGHARVIAVDRKRDLALLEIGTSDTDDTTPSVPWSQSSEFVPGTLAAIVPPAGFESQLGNIATGATNVPAIEGAIPVIVENGEDGVIVVGVVKEVFLPGHEFRFPLRKGDVITHVGTTRIRTTADWSTLHKGWLTSSADPRIAGEQVKILYSRDGVPAEVIVSLALNHNAQHYVRASSGRATGFENAIIGHFFRSRPENCGAPVIDVHGHVIGVFIAKSETVEDIVLPVGEVMSALRLLEADAAHK